jgi:hypothetical protein
VEIAPGQGIDGFRLEEPLGPGGMSSLWRVSRADVALPLLMKIPFLRGGTSRLGIVGFEVSRQRVVAGRRRGAVHRDGGAATERLVSPSPQSR